MATEPKEDRRSQGGLFVAGAVGGLAEGLAVQPLDMVKTRFQISSTPNPSIVTALTTVVREEGFLRLYRGILPELTSLVPKSSIMYSTYEMVRRKGEERNGGVMSTEIAFVAGYLSGVTEALTVQVFQVPKVRLQAAAYNSRYSGTLDCVRQMWRDEPLSAFGRGFGPTLARNTVWNSVYFALMHQLKEFLPQSETRVGNMAQTLVTGFGAGIVATGFNAPFDAAKSRMQAELALPGTPFKYTGTLQTLGLVYKEEGLAACYKGFAPKAARMAIGGAVCMAVFELIVSFIDDDGDE